MRNQLPASIILSLLLIAITCHAQPISDPENVTSMKAGVMQAGKISLKSLSGLASAEDLRLTLYVPQNDSRQKSSITKVMGPDKYEMATDGYGNTQIVLSWQKPPLDTPIDYLIETEVEAAAVSSGVTRDFPITETIEPSKGIVETAYNVAGEGMSIDNALAIGAWVNDNIRYDTSCESQAYPAKWVYSEGRGTCDEFSNLMLSMLRTLGYKAWYVAGYAYLGGKQEGSESFGSHAWVGTRIDGTTYGIDPTWAESPIDATHIAFARLPDSNFTENTGVRSRDVSINWEKDETRITLEDYEEGPRMRLSLTSFPESAEGGKSVIIRANAASEDCVLTSMRIASCINEDGSDMLDILQEKRAPVHFCGEESFYWTAKTPRVKPGLKYTCPVIVAGGGTLQRVPVTVTSESSGDLEVSVFTKSIFLPGEEADMTVSVSGSRDTGGQSVFLLLGGALYEANTGNYRDGRSEAEFIVHAPETPGEYNAMIVAESGDYAEETIEVVTERTLSITEIGYTPNVMAGRDCTINVTVTSSGNASGATLKLQIGDKTENMPISVGEGPGMTKSLNCSVPGEGTESVIVSVLDSGGSYQDSWTGSITFEGEKSLKQNISSWLEDLITGIIDAIKSLFGG